MEDWMLDPRAFAEANERARLEHLDSLTLESAAVELEQILDLAPEFWNFAEQSGVPLLPPPPPAPSLAVLLGSDPPRE